MPEACNFIKKETLAQVFSVDFVKFLITPFFIEHLGWLLLNCMGAHFVVWKKTTP